MKTGVVSQTALSTAMGRALETNRSTSDRLFEDPYALGFLPVLHQSIVRLLRVPVLGPGLLRMRDRKFPGIIGNLLCRTRFIDDALRQSLREGIEQVLILGAGLDSRAYRIGAPEHVRFFEVDHPDTQAWKRTRARQILNGRSASVTHVPVDFQRETSERGMALVGFPKAQTTVIWEGVTQYIGSEAVDATFQYITEATEPGSSVVFTYVHSGLIDGSVQMPGAESLLQKLDRLGEPWCFGIDPSEVARYLACRGFRLIHDVGAADYRERYLDPAGRELGVFEGERVAVAEVVGR
jgi:methyltransferase (TIGR00027 family)